MFRQLAGNLNRVVAVNGTFMVKSRCKIPALASRLFKKSCCENFVDFYYKTVYYMENFPLKTSCQHLRDWNFPPLVKRTKFSLSTWEWFFPPAWCPLRQYLVSSELLINFFYTSSLLMAPLGNEYLPI